MKIQVQEFQKVEPFLKILEEVIQEKDKRQIPVKDFKKLLKENRFSINYAKLSKEQFLRLNKNFEALKRRFSTEFCDETSKKVVEALKKYHIFGGLEEVSDILAMLKACGGQLGEIDLSWNFETTDDVIKQIVRLYPRLEFLSAGLLCGVESESFMGIKKLKNLKGLEIQGFGKLDGDTMIKEVVSKLPNLEYLSLSNCDDVTDEGIKHLSQLKHLKKITLCGEKVTTQGFINLLDKMRTIKKEDAILEK